MMNFKLLAQGNTLACYGLPLYFTCIIRISLWPLIGDIDSEKWCIMAKKSSVTCTPITRKICSGRIAKKLSNNPGNNVSQLRMFHRALNLSVLLWMTNNINANFPYFPGSRSQPPGYFLCTLLTKQAIDQHSIKSSNSFINHAFKFCCYGNDTHQSLATVCQPSLDFFLD